VRVGGWPVCGPSTVAGLGINLVPATQAASAYSCVRLRRGTTQAPAMQEPPKTEGFWSSSACGELGALFLQFKARLLLDELARIKPLGRPDDHDKCEERASKCDVQERRDAPFLRLADPAEQVPGGVRDGGDGSLPWGQQ
jgi:hypothetical protein